ncbi:MAG: YihA family ribosome biogenesis GTP-binding protein [Bacteroidaceae bacterium]|nr:YihA family ribosome biogenesis GTP-binding protein [Bacteroidaceae bacterium]
MKIKTADFVVSNTQVEKCPNDGRPEYAFIGRSNVGKSSLINRLTGRKNLAMTSATPGKTLLINHFLINSEWYLVDLPGYGYAKRGKKEAEKLKRIIKSYVCGRASLTLLFVLVDARHSPQRIDLEFIHFLGEEGVPFSLIFTKADKVSAAVAQANINLMKKTLSEEWESLPPIFLTSSERGLGCEELLSYIGEINAQLGEK